MQQWQNGMRNAETGKMQLNPSNQRKLNERNRETANATGISLNSAERDADDVVLEGEATDAAAGEDVAEVIREVVKVEEAREDEPELDESGAAGEDDEANEEAEALRLEMELCILDAGLEGDDWEAEGAPLGPEDADAGSEEEANGEGVGDDV